MNAAIDIRLKIAAKVFPPLIVLFFILYAPVYVAAGQIPDIPGYYIASGRPNPWPDILRCLGLQATTLEEAKVLILPEGYPDQLTIDDLPKDRILVLTGDSAMARELGIRKTLRQVSVRQVRDHRRPELKITWRKPVEIHVFETPAQADVLMRERKHGAPLMAVLQVGRASVLWLAVSPGAAGYERYPYLLQTLLKMGLKPLFQSRRLWAFFDPAFQRKRDFRELAREWRQEGLAAVHVGVWDYFDANPTEDARLRCLMKACHDEGIMVYAWLELPHVSESFWRRYPSWREKTARGKDAAVGWRLLINLVNPDCRRAVVKGVYELLKRFDWDGVNLGELYFEGPDGLRNPAAFTPLNDDVRREVKAMHGFDPADLFRGPKPNPRNMRIFLDYRIDLAARLQESWIEELEKIRVEKPNLDLVLTYVDDRFDTTMRDAIGADAARSIRGSDQHNLTFIVEDPYTLWRLGPKRYRELASRYRPLTSCWGRLGVDINIVDRGEAFPTAMQTGVELAQLIHTAAESFPRVMYYYTGSINPFDAPLLPYAAAVVSHVENTGRELVVDSPHGVDVRWSGPLTLDGHAWTAQNEQWVQVPPGRHTLRPLAD